MFFTRSGLSLVIGLVFGALRTDAAAPVTSSPLEAHLPPHYVALLRKGRGVAIGNTANLDSALVTATEAAKQAWAAAKAVEALEKVNAKYVPQIEAAIATAEAAAATAKEQDDAATVLLVETRAGTQAAALQAAQAYLMEVKQASQRMGSSSGGGPGPGPAPSPMMASSAGEGPGPVEAAAVAAARAAAPYNAALLRGREAVMDYKGRAEALETAAEKLFQQGAKYLDDARMQEVSGMSLPAERMKLRANELAQKGEKMEQEADQLRATSLNTSAVFPAYRMAAQAAVNAAAQGVEPASTTETPLPY